MRISDWSSDVCSSDLTPAAGGLLAAQEHPQEHQDRCDPAACRKKMDKARSKPDRACHALTSGRVAVPCQRSECAARQRRRQREGGLHLPAATRSEEHTSELPSLMRNPYAVFCLKKQKKHKHHKHK